MLRAHFCRLLKGCVVGRHLLGCTAIIVWHDPVFASIGKAAHQMTHRPRRQLQRFGEGGHRLSLLPTGQNCLPNRDRNRSRHEIILRDAGQDQSTAPMIIRTAVAAKPNVGINGKRLCRVTVLRTPGIPGVRSTSPLGLLSKIINHTTHAPLRPAPAGSVGPSGRDAGN